MVSSEYMYRLATDEDFLARLTVAAAQAGEPYPEAWAREHGLECVIAVQAPVETYQKIRQDPYAGKPALDPRVISESHLIQMVTKTQEKLAKKDVFSTAAAASVSTQTDGEDVSAGE